MQKSPFLASTTDSYRDATVSFSLNAEQSLCIIRQPAAYPTVFCPYINNGFGLSAAPSTLLWILRHFYHSCYQCPESNPTGTRLSLPAFLYQRAREREGGELRQLFSDLRVYDPWNRDQQLSLRPTLVQQPYCGRGPTALLCPLWPGSRDLTRSREPNFRDPNPANQKGFRSLPGFKPW